MQSHDIVGKGNIHVKMPLGKIKNIANVLYILELKKNLLNMSKIVSQNYIVVFDSKQCLVIHKQDH